MTKHSNDENANEIALKEEIAILSSIIRDQEEQIAELKQGLVEMIDMEFEDEISDEEEYGEIQ